MAGKTQVKCPTCGKMVEWSEQNPYRPFCSERCKLIDLGAWADGSHAIPGSSPGDFELNNDDDSGD